AEDVRDLPLAAIFRKWELDAVVIGRVTDTGAVVVKHRGSRVAEIPSKYLTDEAPRYERTMRPPAAAVSSSELRVSSSENPPAGDEAQHPGSEAQPKSSASTTGKTNSKPETRNSELRSLLSSPNVASKEWVYRQYDHMVRTNTVVLPGADAAVVRIKETRRALAMCLDGNGRYCAVSPREGARLSVAEAARNVVCVGARPLAITNCLNFASPERPEVMWSFSEVIDGMAEACRALGTPVVSGNVSFYNETEGRGVHPTPVIGMVGLVEDVRRVVTQWFKREGHLVALFGETAEDLSVSEYAFSVAGRTVEDLRAEGARVPRLDLERERAVQRAVLRAAEEGLLQSAHDCSDGGLAVALAESCFSSLGRAPIGAEVELSGPELSEAAHLFSETPSRVVVSFDESARPRLEQLAAEAGAPFRLIGRVAGDRLRVSVNGTDCVSQTVAELESAWRSALPSKLQVEVLATMAE
ncbi:MAG TPA: AIR synthase related protein, partial [Pyrinomonadaceae bacterium]|nr:AIR synthase related protein [Pyrinomonadaceae bacterium]